MLFHVGRLYIISIDLWFKLKKKNRHSDPELYSEKNVWASCSDDNREPVSFWALSAHLSLIHSVIYHPGFIRSCHVLICPKTIFHVFCHIVNTENKNWFIKNKYFKIFWEEKKKKPNKCSLEIKHRWQWTKIFSFYFNEYKITT